MTKLNYEKQKKIELGAKGEVFDRKKENEKYNPNGKSKKSCKNKTMNKQNRTYLNVPFDEKNEAKKRGAKWDAKAKKWFCVGQINQFRKWIKSR
jgi:hypothetical protein